MNGTFTAMLQLRWCDVHKSTILFLLRSVNFESIIYKDPVIPIEHRRDTVQVL